MAQVLAVLNLKGGCGKSTLAVNLACELSRRSTVSLIDADEQGTAAHYAAKGLLPVTCRHAPLETSKVARWVEQALGERADFLVIDAPPHVGATTQAIVGLADLALVPCTPSGADLVATATTLELIRTARRARADQGPRCLLIPSRVDRRTINGRDIEQALETLGECVSPAVHQRTAFVDAFSAGRWIGDYAPVSEAHQDIERLARRVRRGAC